MAVVNTNIGASVAQAALARNERALNTAMEQLSTGRKINSAADNAAGLAISTRMTSQIRGIDQAIRNAHDAVSMIQTAEGALDEITNMLQRMRELAIQAGTGSTDSADRTYLNAEFVNLKAEIERVANNTEWNGRTVLDGAAGGAATVSGVTYPVGMDPSQTISTSFGNFTNTGTDGMSGVLSTTLSSVAVASAVSNASNAMVRIDAAITNVSAQRAQFGAISNRLIHAVDNLTNIMTNAAESRSRIMDTDYAKSTSELARAQIIQQAGTAMLAQANQLPQTVLQLVQG